VLRLGLLVGIPFLVLLQVQVFLRVLAVVVVRQVPRHPLHTYAQVARKVSLATATSKIFAVAVGLRLYLLPLLPLVVWVGKVGVMLLPPPPRSPLTLAGKVPLSRVVVAAVLGILQAVPRPVTVRPVGAAL
jgi:hypothetical protein